MWWWRPISGWVQASLQHPPDLCLRAHALQHWDSGLHLLFALPTKKALVVQGTQATPPSTVFSSQNRRAKLLPRDSAKCQRSSGRLPVQRLWAACRHVVMSLHLLSHGQSDWSAASHPKSGAAAPGTTIKALHRPATRPAGVCLHHLRSADGRAQDVHTCRVPSAQPVCGPADARVSHRGPQLGHYSRPGGAIPAAARAPSSARALAHGSRGGARLQCYRLWVAV